jgi:hypothetical protein
MDMRFGTWNVRSLYRLGSLKTVARELGKYKLDMKILLGDFNSKVGSEDIFKPRIGNESSHDISNDNGVKSSKLCHI